MKKPKRKYTQKVTPDAPQSNSSPIKEESNITLPIKYYSAPYGGEEDILLNGRLVRGTKSREITQMDIDLLPPSLKAQLEAVTRMRKVLKLPDNIKERTEQMVRRFRGS